MTEPGVSIPICCHNSAGRLAPTLQHLKRQVVPKSIPWEVMVIDNASTDKTLQMASEIWGDFPPANLRVVREPKIGLSYARIRGFQEAQYEYISFIDDDNWVAPDWVETVYRVMTAHPEVGACGGRSEAVFEEEPPTWFKKYERSFVIGEQGKEYGDITWGRGWLWGAGLTVRKTAWKFLVDNDFKPVLRGRTGKRLTSGEDVELCFALRLAGWNIWLDEQLILQHYIPAERLSWGYARKLMRGIGAASVGFIPYKLALTGENNIFMGRTGKIWTGKLCGNLKRLTKMELKWFFSRKRPVEGDDEILEMERLRGSLGEFIKKREHLDLDVNMVRNAKWNIIGNQRRNGYQVIQTTI